MNLMKPFYLRFLNWTFALLFSAVGMVNILVGNDLEYGVFIVLVSLFFYPPIHIAIEKKTGWTIPKVLLVLLALFIIWSSLGVGELWAKIQLLPLYFSVLSNY